MDSASSLLESCLRRSESQGLRSICSSEPAKTMTGALAATGSRRLTACCRLAMTTRSLASGLIASLTESSFLSLNYNLRLSSLIESRRNLFIMKDLCVNLVL